MSNLDILQLNSYNPKKIAFWMYNDDEKRWNKNRKKEGKDWYFYNANDIEYKHNSYGYRCDEFEKYEWKNYVLFLGCSNVYGKGNYEKDTIPSQYAKITGQQIINMGVCGAGPDTIHHNTIALIEKNYIPKKVIICWPEPTRQMWYTGDDIGSGAEPIFLGSWQVKNNTNKKKEHLKKSLKKQVLWENFIESSEHYKTVAYLIQSSVIKAWTLAGVPIQNYYFQHGKFHKIHSIQHAVIRENEGRAFPFRVLPRGIDRARDCVHWGPKSNKIYAEYIDKYT